MDAPRPVVVEIAPPESPPELKRALLDACSRATQSTTCVESTTEQTEATEEPGEAAPAVVAIVSWRDDAHVRLQVALRREQKWVAREIAFDARDVAEERWRAVGLVIGTLGSVMVSGESSPAPAPPPAVEKKPEARPPPPPPKPLPPLPRLEVRRGFIDASAVLGTALDRGSPRLGAELGGSALVHGSGLHVSASLAYSEGVTRTEGVRTTFAEAAAGLLFARGLGGALVAEGHAEGFLERFGPSVAADSPAPTSGNHVVGGVRLGGGFFFWGAAPVGFFVDGAIRWAGGTTAVEVQGHTIGTTPAFGPVLRVGAAYEL